ncbi:hypothetical protein [Thiocystis violascens]|uniref:Glycosyltransferase n=1 Tax=Thiocystis violascens (strain ATCC 17096 / DSM 198 / 6111) TaxID=765911 RepID=I3Y5D5_THIV6|nr:hypothetical protein [Thiocystis violascens]AFL72203.1 hypothetical protein Thivi_0127 [Thiocystis violascens DSM 198]
MNKMNISVIGTQSHEGIICGDAFNIIGTDPVYYYPGSLEQLSSDRPDAVILSREWNPDIRLAAAELRRQNIPIIYVMDGVIEWSYIWNNQSFVLPHGTVLQPLIANYLCVIGRHPARILASLGLADRINIVGLPRLDGIDRYRCQIAGNKPKIVIATAKTYSHNLEHKLAVKRAVMDLKLFFDENQWMESVWRISHELADELGICPQTEGSMVDVLRDAAGLLSFTSTSLLEAMLLGLPTAQVDYRSVPIYVQTAWEIRCADHIESVIQELLYPPDHKLAYQAHCLEDELEFGSASQRLADVILRAVMEKKNMNSPAPMRDPCGQLDYRLYHSQLSAFAMSPKSLLQYELDASHKALLETRIKLEETRHMLEDHQQKLRRIISHIVLGPIVRIWARIINPNLFVHK